MSSLCYLHCTQAVLHHSCNYTAMSKAFPLALCELSLWLLVGMEISTFVVYHGYLSSVSLRPQMVYPNTWCFPVSSLFTRQTGTGGQSYLQIYWLYLLALFIHWVYLFDLVALLIGFIYWLHSLALFIHWFYLFDLVALVLGLSNWL